jgi:hypothetical protein
MVHELYMAFRIPYEYDYLSTLHREQAEVVTNDLFRKINLSSRSRGLAISNINENIYHRITVRIVF